VAKQTRQQRIHAAPNLIESTQCGNRALTWLAQVIAVGLHQLQVGVAAGAGGLEELGHKRSAYIRELLAPIAILIATTHIRSRIAKSLIQLTRQSKNRWLLSFGVELGITESELSWTRNWFDYPPWFKMDD
jgi:hypothetical protein